MTQLESAEFLGRRLKKGFLNSKGELNMGNANCKMFVIALVRIVESM